jgi:hypothetical protein
MRVSGFFVDGGPLARAFGPGYRSRPEQVRMAEAVARAIASRGALLADAPTGTGKSLVYLVPAALSGSRVVVSTATKALQHQLVEKDLPALCRALAKDAHMCTGSPCTGTNQADNLWEFPHDGRNDVILGRRGDDRLHAETNNRDRDELRGQGGGDILNVAYGDGNDLVAGGPGRDHCVADSYREIGVGCEWVRIR